MGNTAATRAGPNTAGRGFDVGRGIDATKSPIPAELKRAQPAPVSRERSLVATILDQFASEKVREIAASGIRAMINNGTFFTATMEPLVMSIVKADPKMFPEAAQLQVILATDSRTCAPATMVLITSQDQVVRFTTIERVLRDPHSDELQKKVLTSDRLLEHRAKVARETSSETIMEFIANLPISEKTQWLKDRLMENPKLTDRVKVIHIIKKVHKALGSTVGGRK